MSLPRQADGISKETEFAGLPKSAFMYNSALQTPSGAGAQYIVAYDTVLYNYGPYVPVTYTGFPALYQGFLVSEPGIYDIAQQVALVVAGQAYRVGFIPPGTVPLTFGQFEVTGVAEVAPGIKTIQSQCKGIYLAAGTFVPAYIIQQAVPQNTFALFSWYSIEKKGGQY